MRDEIERFVASLAIPEPRKTVVLAELLDHAASAREAAQRGGRDPDLAEREAVGDLEAMRRALETVEPAFHVSRWSTLVRGIAGGIAIAIAVDQLKDVAFGVLAAAIALALAIACAPPRLLELLRPEVRKNRIGPAITYIYAITSTPFLVWIGMIVFGAFAFGTVQVDVPWCAFVLLPPLYGILLVEMFRARVTA